MPRIKILNLPATDNSPSSYKCCICGQVFRKMQSLGGHMSKGHPGMNINYQRKVEIRNSRTFDRECLTKAKKILEEEGLNCKKYKARATIIKKKLM